MMLAALLALRLLGRWKALPGALLVIAAGIGLDALGYCRPGASRQWGRWPSVAAGRRCHRWPWRTGCAWASWPWRLP